MADRFIYCIKVELEVGYCEFVYVVSAIFLLLVSAKALVGRRFSPFLGKQRSVLCYGTILLFVLSLILVYCGQTVRWIRMSFGVEVGLGPVDIVHVR